MSTGTLLLILLVVEGILPDSTPVETRRLLQEAHRTCPYSRALRGEATADLVAA